MRARSGKVKPACRGGVPRIEGYPLSAGYDSAWVFENEMGPSALWLAEALSKRMGFVPGMRVLDLGCGRGMSSVFLAREFESRVTAADLWISPDENFRTFAEAGVLDRVFPLRAEAHDLPFASGYFDAIVSIDSYQYYGTDDMYLKYVLRFLRKGGAIGIVVPGLTAEFKSGVPEYLTRRQKSGAVFWDPAECFSFHTPAWWRNHWEKTGLVDVEHAGLIEDGWRLWLSWEEARDGGGFSGFPSDAEAIREDAGKHLGFAVVVGRKR